jgi:hypothetical protein
MGTQLFYLMREAGLPPPECRAESIMDGGPHSLICEWLAETLITLSPRFQALGMTAMADMDSATHPTTPAGSCGQGRCNHVSHNGGCLRAKTQRNVRTERFHSC